MTAATARPGAPPSTLVIACGALARELLDVIALNGWTHMTVTCLPAKLHNEPQRITEAVRTKIQGGRRKYERVLCLYGDCGTGGRLDAMLAEEGVERIDGDHCYAFYTGIDAFNAMHAEEPGTFYLTDYLAKHFDRLVWKGLGLDRHPELRDAYFGNYKRVVFLEQKPDPVTRDRAEAAARRLGLAFESRATGLGGVQHFLERADGRRAAAG